MLIKHWKKWKQLGKIDAKLIQLHTIKGPWVGQQYDDYQISVNNLRNTERGITTWEKMPILKTT